MNRLLKAVGALALAWCGVVASPAQAQQTGNWTLNIDNRHGAAPIPAGGEAAYDIRLTNNGNYDTPAGEIVFTIPATTIYRGVTGLESCTPQPDGALLGAPLTVTCDVPVLTPGQDLMADVLITPMMGDCDGNNCVIDFEGKVSNPGGPLPAGAVQKRSTTITKGADLELGLSLEQTTVKAGSFAGFTVTVKNNGPYASSGGRVVIPLPTGMGNVRLPAGCELSGGNIVCTVPGSLEPGEEYAFDLSAQVTAGDGSTISIAGRVEGGAPQDAVSDNDNDSAELAVVPGTDVRLQKGRAPGGLLLVGDDVTFTLTPAHSGGAPQSATIVDTIPDNYAVAGIGAVQAPAGWSCGLSGRTVTCEFTAGPGAVYGGPITIAAKAMTETGNDGVVNTATIASPDENDDAPQDNNSAQDVRADIREPITDLRAHKSGPPRGLVTVGSSYDFRLSASNRGNKPFTDEMTITDHLPAGLTVTAIDAPAGWNCPVALPIGGPAEIVCTTNQYQNGGLPVGDVTQPIVLTAEVTQAGSISNGMTVSFPNYEGIDPTIGDNTVQSGVSSADDANWANIGVEKRVSPSAIEAGGEVTFTIEVYNEGPKDATRVQITDRLNDIVGSATGGQPADITPVIHPGVATGASCSSVAAGDYGRNLECAIDTLPVCVKGSGNCPTIEVTVRPGSQGAKTNTANAYSLDVPDNNLRDNESTVSYTVNPRTDVTVTKTSPAASGASAGQEITYTLTARVPGNGLSAADDVTITDTLPEGVVFVRANASTGTCSTLPAAEAKVSAPNNRVICNLGTIANGSQQTVEVVVIPTTELVETEILNLAAVLTTTPETDEDNNDAELRIGVVPPRLDLIISKTDAPVDPVEITAPVTYTIDLQNAGPSDAFNLIITDTLPSGGFTNPVLVDVPAGLLCTPAETSTTLPGGQITCTLDRLKAGEAFSFKVRMTSFEKGRFENVVSVVSDETIKGYEGPTANNLDREDTTVRTRADVSVVKTPSATEVDLRKEFYWDVVVTNEVGAGYDVAEEVTLTDTLPAGMVLTRVPDLIPATAGTCTGTVGQREITCDFGDVDAGASITVRLYTKITDMGAQAASNTATVDTKSFDKKPENNKSTGKVTTVRGSTVSGRIFKDFNNNGVVDQSDSGIGNATVTLTGTATHDNSPVSRTVPVNVDGTYAFTDLPPGTYEVSYTIPNSGDYSSEPGDGQAIPGNNPAGEGTAGSNGKTVIANIVTSGEYEHENNDFTLVPLPKVGIGKTVGAPAFQTDGSYTLAYTVKVKNHSGEPLVSVNLTDVMSGTTQNFGTAAASSATLQPGEYKVLNITGSGIPANSGFDGNGTPLLVSNGSLAAGATATITFTVQVQPQVPWVGTSTLHTNQAEVTAVGEYTGKTTTDKSHNTPNGEETPANNTPTTVTVTPTPSIALTKTATPERIDGAAEVGDRIDYSFTVENTGNVPLVNITLSDPLPNLKDLEPTTIARLEPGATYSGAITAYYELTQADLDRGFVNNTATVVGQWGVNGATPLTVQDQKSANVPSLSDPKIELVKDIVENFIQNPRTEVGDTVRYSFKVTNSGNTKLKNVTVFDPLPGLTQDPATAFAIGDLAPGETKTVYAVRRQHQ